MQKSTKSSPDEEIDGQGESEGLLADITNTSDIGGVD